MEHTSIKQLERLSLTRTIASVETRDMHRNRLSRWADVLESDPEREVWLYRNYEGARIRDSAPYFANHDQ